MNMQIKPQVLVVDDEESIRKLLKSRLERDGAAVETAPSADDGITWLKANPNTAVVVTDLKMPGRDGFAFMQWIKKEMPHTRVLLITGHGEKAVAIRALKDGASDYLEKPFDLDELAHSVKRCLEESRLERENATLLERLQHRVARAEGKREEETWYVSKARAMAKVNEWLDVLRRESMRMESEEPTVLILGESGTGKEGVARHIHSVSRRGKGPWVAVNCANFTDQLLESELFGHEKGAFTGALVQKKGLFEIAQGGTLFLDEIGEMDAKLQARMLRVLQEKNFRRLGGTADITTDVRIVAATNQDLPNRVKQGKFRDDLYHRLSRVVMELPPLRNRTEDIVPMAELFARRAFGSRGKTFAGYTEDAMAAMSGYTWPGNVRELLNVVERAALLFEGNSPLSETYLSLPKTPGAVRGPKLVEAASEEGTALGEGEFGAYAAMKKRWERAFEKEYLVALLERNHGNVSAASREAKVDRSNLLRLMRRNGLKAEAYRAEQEVATNATPKAA